MDKTKYDELFDTYFKGAVDIMKDQITNSLIQLFTENIIKNYENNPGIFTQKFKVKYITDIDVGSHVLEVIQDDIAKFIQDDIKKSQEESFITGLIYNKIRSRIENEEVPIKTDDEITVMIKDTFDTLECFIVEYYDINYIAESKPHLLGLFEGIQSELAVKTEFHDLVDVIRTV